MSYEAIYAATRNALGNPDICQAIESVCRDTFDISWLKSQAQEAIGVLRSEYERPFVVMRPSMSIDGNQWLALYGENIQEGVAGFGDSPYLASIAFDKAWYQLIAAYDAAKAQETQQGEKKT